MPWLTTIQIGEGAIGNLVATFTEGEDTFVYSQSVNLEEQAAIDDFIARAHKSKIINDNLSASKATYNSKLDAINSSLNK